MSDLTTRLEQATKHARNNDWANAIESLKLILEKDADHEIATGMLASIYLQIGHLDAAIEHYERLLQLNPDNPLARFQLGLAHMNNGDTEDALSTWKPMLEMENEFMAHFHAALATLQLGRNAEASALLARAEQQMPSSHPLYPKLIELRNNLGENRSNT